MRFANEQIADATNRIVPDWQIANSAGVYSGMLLVEIEKPESEPLSAWFSALRSWLDANHCAPSVFARSGRRIDRLIYRISFDDPTRAHHFTQAFSHYAPTIRRATLFEREQLRAMAATQEKAAS